MINPFLAVILQGAGVGKLGVLEVDRDDPDVAVRSSTFKTDVSEEPPLGDVELGAALGAPEVVELGYELTHPSSSP
jgi:hypothetical protein